MWRSIWKSAVVPMTVTSRWRAPKRAGASPMASGATRRTTRSLRIASASPSVRSLGTPPMIGAPPVVSTLPGSAITRFVPSEANSPVT